MPAGLYFDNDTSLYITGVYSGTTGFGSNILTPIGDNDIFITKLSIGKPVGVAESPNMSSWMIYPNPTTGLITITGLLQEATRITVYNVLGELVYDQLMTDPDNALIDLSNLPDGVYLLQLQYGREIMRGKIIKQ